MGVPQNGWFILENPVEMDDLGTPIIGTAHLIFHGLLDASVHCGETADGLDSGQVDEGSLSGAFAGPSCGCVWKWGIPPKEPK